jgi:hypothetical protein
VRWQRLTDPFRGRASLAQAFWLYGCGVSVGYVALGWLLEPRTPVAILMFLLVGIAIGLVQSVVFWQCAFNSRFRSLGVLLRAWVILGVLSVPVILYAVFKYPELLTP